MERNYYIVRINNNETSIIYLISRGKKCELTYNYYHLGGVG